MKSSAPWSVKGIRRDARETAKQAARRQGMTVGEWLSQVIYAAGDPESSDGEIEGIKTSDIVTAIEHLNKRVIAAENRGAEAIDDLARKLGGALERLQRLERTRPTEGAPGVEERLQKLEARAGDRQRIEALRALEKAVSQVALQYDSAHKETLSRLDETERELQELASRLDNAGGEESSVAVSELRETMDALAEKVDRAERVAAEAMQLKTEAGESFDAEFVERTGARLRILGDEIKRSGDQIRTLEGLIKKLSDQIDAAERRSSEGVQKVAETISELRSKFGQPETAEAGETRQEIEAAMAEVTQRTESRIAELQRSFESMIARIETPGGGRSAPAAARETRAETKPSAEAETDARPDESGEAATDIDAIFAEIRDDVCDSDDEEEAAFSFDEDAPEDAEASAEANVGKADAGARNGAEAEEREADAENAARAIFDAFGAFDEEGEDAAAAENETNIEDISSESARRRDEEPADPLSALLADSDAAPPGGGADGDETPPPASESGRAQTAGDQPRRRKLTPKQRALLAAKIRRKRLAEKSRTDAGNPADAESAPAGETVRAERPETEAGADIEDAGDSVLTKAAGAVAGLRARLPGAQGRAPEAEPDEKGESESAEADAPRGEEPPNLLRSARAALARAGVRPVTLALGAALVLAAAALFFLVNDLTSGEAPDGAGALSQTPAADADYPDAEQQATPEDGEQARPETVRVPEAPEAPVTRPRALYLDAVAKLESAENDAQTRDALKLLQQAAALGHPPAQLQLGELYKLGQGVEQDPAQARVWYERAADGGNVLAMHRLGVMAARGQGGPLDVDMAIGWFRKAANFGLVDSQYNLGATYHPASGGAATPLQDAGEAYYWYSLAARNGDEQARSLAEGLAASLAPDERRAIDARVESWRAETPDPEANEVAPGS